MLLRRQQPSRQAGAGVGGGGPCRPVGTAAKQLFAGHPDGVCCQRGTLVGALKSAPFIWPGGIFQGKVLLSAHALSSPSDICRYVHGPMCEPKKTFENITFFFFFFFERVNNFRHKYARLHIYFKETYHLR